MLDRANVVFTTSMASLKVENFCIGISFNKESNPGVVPRDRAGERGEAKTATFEFGPERALFISKQPGLLGLVQLCDQLSRHEVLLASTPDVAHTPAL